MMAQEKSTFSKSEFVAGLNFDKLQNIRLLEVVLETEQDAEMLMGFYHNAKRDKEFTATSKLKEFKVNNCPIGFEAFMEMYLKEGSVKAFRRLFWDDVIEEDVAKYASKYLEKFSLKELYESYMKKPHTPFLKFIKNI